ncbi:MAG: exodeoxyribonuclease VII small subunit [Methanophagales archaeon]|nr:exodeoxyribonuclease VII small subunit [Methanophagales archaeon]RLG34833.1 MAG: exodeoxyribonuclease VII small subunit [Methanosarcinales archaeon]
MEEKGEAITFEDAMKRLESIVETLGEGNLSLEDSLKIFEEGMELCRFCNKKLDEAEYKVEKLMEREGGEISMEEFKVAE